MHFVFLNQYYPPNVAPTGVMLEAVVQRLVRDGHSVTVLCASGGYGESAPATLARDQEESSELKKGEISSGQAVIVRIGATQFGRGTMLGKLLDYASYYSGVMWKLGAMSPRPDRIVALTTPPYLSVVARAASWFRRADHAHWVMDLYPDVMVAHGMLREGGMLQRVLGGLARWGFGGKRCAAVLTLGPDMAERVGHYVSAASKQVEWVPLWGSSPNAIPDRNTGVPPVMADSASRLYNGNTGVSTVMADSASRLSNGNTGVSPVTADSASRLSNGNTGVSPVTADRRPACSPEEDATGGTPVGHDRRDACPPVNKATGGTPVGHDRRDACPPVNKATGGKPVGHDRLDACPPLGAVEKLRQARGWRDEETVVMYSGNMGLGHRFGEILEVALTLKAEPIRFAFYGSGKRRGEVEAFLRNHPECKMELHGYAPAEELGAHLRSADVHLASLDAAWTGTMVPSKLQGIFAAGKPVIFVGSEQSSIGQWILTSGAGWVVAPTDCAGLRAALMEAGNPEVRERCGQAAAAFAAEHFDEQTNVVAVAAILGCERDR